MVLRFVGLDRALEVAQHMRHVAEDLAPGHVPTPDHLWRRGWRIAYPMAPDEAIAVEVVEQPGALWVVRWEAVDIRPLGFGLAGLLCGAARRMAETDARWSDEVGLAANFDLLERLGAWP